LREVLVVLLALLLLAHWLFFETMSIATVEQMIAVKWLPTMPTR
jgi:hypothetical protein